MPSHRSRDASLGPARATDWVDAAPAVEGCFARGSQLTFVLHEDNDDAVGVFLFGSVLQRFLGLASGINSFVETVFETKQRDGMLAHFEPHAGEEPRL